MKKRVNENEVLDLDKLGDYEESYVLIPKDLVHKDLTPCVVMVGATINGYSGREQGDGTTSHCHRTYEGFRKELGFAHGTIGKALSSLSKAGYIILADKRSYYDFARDKVSIKRYYRLDLRFVRRPIRIKHEGIRFLTPSEILVLAYFYTYCKNRKKTDKSKEASIQDIAKELNLSERTVWQAIRTLLRASLIYRPAGDKGVNRSKVSRFHLDRRLQNLKRKRKNEQQPSSSAAQLKQQKYIQDANARADRAKWYAIRRNKAEGRADRIERQAMADPEYKDIFDKLSKAEREAAKAEVRGLSTLPELERRLKILKENRASVLKRMGLKESDFVPQYYCVSCSDSGYLPNGRACNCYNQRE